MDAGVARPRQPLTGVALCAVAGVMAADFFECPPGPVLGAVALALGMLIFFPRTASAWILSFAVFFALHTVRHHGSAARSLSREFGNASHVVDAVGVVWEEPAPPRTPGRIVHARFVLRLESLRLDDGAWRPSDACIEVSWAGAMPGYGDKLSLRGEGRNLAPARNPGQFDFLKYRQRHGVYSEVLTRFAGDCHALGGGHGHPLQALALDTCRRVKAQLGRDLEDSPEIAALIQSMVLGMRGETPEDLKALFQRTGTLHLFAVSGLNVAMLGAILWFLLKPLRVPRAAAVVLTLPVLMGYALLTGLSASCVRATVMGVLVLAAYLVDRRPVLYNSLSAAALVILAWDTNELFSPGFQFSFVLVFTIVWLARKIEGRLRPFGLPDVFLPRPLWSPRQKITAAAWTAFCSTLGVTLAAWCGSLLFTAGYFHLFSLAAIFANLLAVPLAFAVLGLGLLSVLSGGVSTGAVILFNNANWAVARLLLVFIKAFALLPGGHVYVEIPRAAPPCELLVFDLEAGGAVFLRVHGRDWLLDAGSERAYGQSVLPYLRSRGVNRLEGFVLSHGDAQHVGAALSVVEDFAPRHIVDSAVADRSRARRAFHAALAGAGRGKEIVRRGDWLEIGPEAGIRVLFPPVGWQRSSADDKTLVLRLETPGLRVLLMSDSGFATEQWLLENEPDLRADLLIMGRHEKDLSGTAEFLERVRPGALIAAGPGYGRSAAALAPWQAQVRARGTVLFAQEQTGAVHVEMRGDALEMRAFLTPQIFRSRAR